MTKVLFFANIPTNDPRSIGGATVLSKRILEFIQRDSRIQINHSQIRFFWKPGFQLIDYLIWILIFPFKIRKYDIVSIHATKDMHFFLMPILIFWIKIFKKKYCYHFFGGNFHHQFESLNKVHKRIISNTVLDAKTLFFETKKLMDFFTNNGFVNCQWLPNSRLPQKNKRKPFSKRFVFISRIIPSKGIEEIIDVVSELKEDYVIDLYGPIDRKYYSSDILINKVSYKGVVKSENVIDVIRDYDVLILPTYFKGEGYPGIIIEALSLGKPVVSTNFGSIPEIINHKKNGLLIPIKDSNELLKAISSFNDENYDEFSKNALTSFKQFNSENVFKKFTDSFLDGKKIK